MWYGLHIPPTASAAAVTVPQTIQVNSTAAFCVQPAAGAPCTFQVDTINDRVIVGTRNGQQTTVQFASATISPINLAASGSAVGLIPAGSLVLGVTSYNTVAFGIANGLTDIDIGITTDVNRWGDNEGILLGDDTDGDAFTGSGLNPQWFTAATDVVVTAVGGTFDGTGTIRVTVHYMRLEPPTS